MVMKVWYLQVIWQVRDSTIMSMQAIMPRAGKTMTNWLKNSGEKELEHLLNNRRVRNKLRQIKKLLRNMSILFSVFFGIRAIF